MLSLPDRALAAAFLALGPLAALAPRGMPVWLIAAAGLAALAPGTRATLPAILRRHRAAVLTTAAFLALAAISIAWSPSRRAGLTVLELGYVAVAILLLGTWAATLPAAAAGRIARLAAAGLLAGTAVFALELVLDFPLNRWWNALPAGAPVDAGNVPKRTAAILALLVWPAGLALAGPPVRGALPPLAYAGATLLLTSRSALTGMLAGLGTLAAAACFPRTVHTVLAGLLTAGFVLVIPLALLASDAARLDRAGWLFDSARHRVEIWEHAAARALETPLAGQGIDASRALAPRGEVSQFGALTDSLLPLHPHNAFLQVWLELGAVGAGLALALALLALRAVGRLPRPARAHGLALYATGLVMASTAYGLWQAWWMASYAAAGIALALAARRGDGEQG